MKHQCLYGGPEATKGGQYILPIKLCLQMVVVIFSGPVHCG